MNLALILFIVGPALLLIWALATYNRLVAYRNECRSAWAQVDVQLKRRHELLPNLEAVVKGAMAHESQTLEAVTRLRGEAEAASTLGARMSAEGALGLALSGLMVRMEAYPEIRATENAMALQKEIVHTEDRIAFSRTYYNDIVGNYNTLIQAFPALYLARAGGFEAQPWFGEGRGV